LRERSRRVAAALAPVLAVVCAMMAVEMFGDRLRADDMQAQFDKEIATQPIFVLLAKEAPDQLAAFRREYTAMVTRKASSAELQDYVREWGRQALPGLLSKYSASASDATLTGMARESVAMLDALGAVDGEQCYGWMFGGAPPPSAAVRDVYKAHDARLSQAMMAVVDSGRTGAHGPADVAAAQSELQRMFERMAQEQGAEVVQRIASIADREAMKSDFGAACRASASLYRGVLALEPATAGNVLRMMFSPVPAPN
jgi:hypothetical protein